MKVMLVPVIGSAVSCRGTNYTVKSTGKSVPNKQGVTNEEIYNAIISVKKGIEKIFPRSKAFIWVIFFERGNIFSMPFLTLIIAL